jgi:hypothetical protein
MTASLDTPHQVSISLQFNQVLEIVKQLGVEERRKLLLYLLGNQSDKNDLILTHFASEQVLATDWLTETEDEAWQNL